MDNKNKVLKIISLCTVICFTFNTLAQAAPATLFSSNSSTFVSNLQSNSFSLPSELGALQALYVAPANNQPSVYLIEDAHSSKSAQEKIANILGFLKKEKRLDAVFLEGSAGKLSGEQLSFFQNANLNRIFWRKLFSSKMLSGAEQFLLSNQDIPSFGIENVNSYHSNLEIYRSIIGQKNKSDIALSELEGRIAKSRQKTVSKELSVFLNHWEKMHGQQNAPLLNYMNVLFDYSSRILGDNWADYSMQSDWPSLIRIWRIKNIQKNLDYEKAKNEFRALKTHVTDPGMPEIQLLEALLNLSPEELTANRNFEISPRVLAEILMSRLPLNERSMQPYRHFADLMAFLIFQNELNGEVLFLEIGKLEDRIFDVLAQDAESKKYVSIVKDLCILKKALSLELNRDEARDFKNRIEDFRSLNIDGNVKDILPKVVQFYSAANYREGSFLQNYQNCLRNNPSSFKNVVLVAGGYHSDGIQQLLKKNKLSYYVIRPSFSDDSDDSHYRNFLLGDYTQKSYLAPTGMLTAASLGRRMMGDEAFENREHAIAGIKADFVSEQGIQKETETKDVVPNPKGYVSHLGRGRFLAAAFAFILGLAGCAINYPQEVNRTSGVRRAQTDPAVLPLTDNRLDLGNMRTYLYNYNYAISTDLINVMARDRERSLVGEHWQLDANVEHSGDSFTVSGAARGRGGLIAQAGVVLDPTGDKFTLAAQVVFELVQFLTGEKKAVRVAAYARTQTAISEVREEMDRKNLETSELLIDIASLQKQKEILNTWLTRLETLSDAATAAAKNGTATLNDSAAVQDEIIARRSELMEVERQIGEKTSRLMTSISRAPEDLRRSITADVDLDLNLPSWTQDDLTAMISSATTIGTRTVEGNTVNILPPNSRIATAFTRWQEAKAAERAQDLTFTRPEVSDDMFFAQDSINIGQALPALRGNSAISGQTGRESEDALNTLRRVWEIGPHQEARRQVLSFGVSRADISIENAIHETQAEIIRLFRDIQSQQALITHNQEAIEQLDTRLESLRRALPNGRRLIARDFNLVKYDSQRIALQLAVLKAKARIRMDVERMKVLGAVSEVTRGSSLGEMQEKILAKGKILLDKSLKLSLPAQTFLLLLILAILGPLVIASPLLISIGGVLYVLYSSLVIPILGKVKTINFKVERPKTESPKPEKPKVETVGVREKIKREIKKREISFPKLTLPAVSMPKISVPSIDYKPAFSAIALKASSIAGVVSAGAAGFRAILSSGLLYLQGVDWSAKWATVKKSGLPRVAIASSVLIAAIYWFPKDLFSKISFPNSSNTTPNVSRENKTSNQEPAVPSLVINNNALQPNPSQDHGVVPLHPVVAEPQARRIPAIPVRLIDTLEDKIEVPGRTVPLSRGSSVRGSIAFKANTTGRVVFENNIREGSIVEKDTPIVHIINEDLAARITAQQERADAIKTELDRMAEAVRNPEDELPEMAMLELERKLQLVRSNLNQLTRELEVFGTIKAPYPLVITSIVPGGNVAPGSVMFEAQRRDVIRIPIQIAPLAANFKNIRVFINQSAAELVQIVYGNIDVKNNRQDATLDIQLSTPLSNLSEAVDYRVVFENRDSIGSEQSQWRFSGNVLATAHVRAGERLIRNVVAPEMSGITTFDVKEGEAVERNRVLARSEAQNFIETEVVRLTNYIRRVQQFITSTKPRNQGDQWIIPASTVAELNAEGTSIYPIAAARRLTTVPSPDDGILMRSLDQNSQVFRSGDKIAEIWTSRVYAGDVNNAQLENQLLVREDVPLNSEDVVVVQLLSGKQLLAKVLDIRNATENASLDVRGFKTFRIEIYDPELLVYANEDIRVIVPAESEQAQLRTRYEGALKSQVWRQDFRVFPRSTTVTQLPILVETAMRKGSSDKLAENLIQLMIQEENPAYRQQAYDYFVNNLKDDKFYSNLEQLIFSGSEDISQRALRSLRDEKDILRLMGIFQKSIREDKRYVSAFSYELVMELIDLSQVSDPKSPFSILINQPRTPETVQFLVSILSVQGPNSFAGTKILRSPFFTTQNLAVLYRSFKQSNSELAETIRSEMIRRVALNKAKYFTSATYTTTLRAGIASGHWTDQEIDSWIVEENENKDRQFLEFSPYWAALDGHINEKTISGSNSFADQDIVNVSSQAPSIDLIDREIVSLNSQVFPDTAFLSMTLAQQTSYIRSAANYRDLSHLIRAGQASAAQRNDIIHQMIKSSEGTFELARTYLQSGDSQLLSAVENSVFIQSFLESTRSLQALQTADHPDPALFKFHLDVLLKVYARTQSTNLKKKIIVYLLASQVGDYQLRFLLNKGVSDPLFNDMTVVIPRVEVATAAASELERRAVVFALELLPRRFALENSVDLRPGTIAHLITLLKQKTDITNFNYGDESLISFIISYGSQYPMSKQDKEFTDFLITRANQRINDIKTGKYRETSLEPAMAFSEKFLVITASVLGGILFLLAIIKLLRIYIPQTFGAFRRGAVRNFFKNLISGSSGPKISGSRRKIKGRVTDIRKDSKTNGHSNGSSLGTNDDVKYDAAWAELLGKENHERTIRDFGKMLLLAKGIINDDKNTFSLKRMMVKGHVRRSQEIGHRYRELADLAVESMGSILDFAQDENRKLTAAQKEALFYQMGDFKIIAEYSNDFRRMLDLFTHFQLLSGYDAAKYTGDSWIRWGLNSLFRLVWDFLRLIYLLGPSNALERSSIKKMMTRLMIKGNMIEPHLYDSAKILADLENYFKNPEKFQEEMKPVDQIGGTGGWGFRKFITRAWGLLSLAGFILGAVPYFLSRIASYFGVEWDFGSFKPNFFAALISSIAFIVTLCIHWVPIFLYWEQYFFALVPSAVDEFYGEMGREMNALLQEGAELLLPEQKQEDILEKIKNGEYDREEALRFEFNQSLEALRKEKESEAPSVDAIIVIVENKVNKEKEELLRKQLEPWIRKDIPVIFWNEESINGSGIAWLSARNKLKEQYPEYKARFPRLPNNFEHARVITLLANEASNGSISINLTDEEHKLTFPIEFDKKPITGTLMALANAYKAAQTLKTSEKPGQIIVATDKFYVGSVSDEGDITLLGSWTSIDQVIKNQLELVFGFFGDMGRAVKFIKFLGKDNLTRETQKRKKMVDQIDLENDKKNQMPAFAGMVIVSSADAEKYKKINKMFDDIFNQIKDVSSKLTEHDSQNLDLVQDILIPLIIMVEGNNIWTYGAVRNSEAYKNFNVNIITFYIMFFRFISGLFHEKNDKPDIRVSLPNNSFFTPLTVPQDQQQPSESPEPVQLQTQQLPEPAAARSLGYFAVPSAPVIVSDMDQLETALRISYSIVANRRLMKGLDEIHARQARYLSRMSGGASNNPSSLREGKVIIVDAGLFGQKALKQLVRQNQPMMIVFNSKDQKRSAALERFINNLPEDVRAKVQKNVYLAVAPHQVSGYINAVLQPGNNKYLDAQNFLLAHGIDSLFMNSNQFAFLSSDKNEAKKISVLKIGRRFFGAKYLSEDSLIDERVFSRDAALLRFIESQDLWRSDSKLVEDLKPLIDRMIGEIMAAIANDRLILQAA